MLNIISIINKKSKGLSLSTEEINFFVNGVMDNSIPDFQASSLLMAIKINGFNDDETIDYSRALINSGEVLPLEDDIVDKHSSGGVGDKTTISLLPVLGAMGLKVFKISGRGLGFTGGTIDKLESLDGFKAELSLEQVNNMVNDIGISVTGQTPDLTPADGRIYALRDITGTVDSKHLIAASIISKKIASGAKNILIDLKIGTGAFVDNLEDANELARLMKLIATSFNRNLFVLFSSMNQPLGNWAGNKAEVVEAIEFLKGNSSKDFSDLIKKISTELYSKAKGTSLEEAESIYIDVLESGKAFELQKVWFHKHGVIDYEKAIEFNPEHRIVINSTEEGYVRFKDVKNFGTALVEIKAGRKTKTDKLDFNSGINFIVKSGERAEKGQPLFEVTSSNIIPDSVIESIKENYEFKSEPFKSEVILGELKW